MLHDVEVDAVRKAVADGQPSRAPEADVIHRSFFPVTFPLTMGPGTIATAIALEAKPPSQPALYVIGFVMATLGAAITAYVIYVAYRPRPGCLNAWEPLARW